MTDKPKSAAPRAVTSVYPALCILIFAAAMFYAAQHYSETARRFPSLVAGVLVILALIDLWSRTRLPGRQLIAAFWGTDFNRREMSYDPTLKAQLGLIAWVVAWFIGMAAIGVLIAMPLFCFLFAWLRSRRPPIQAATVAAVVFVFEYAVFEWLLSYELYRGLLFSKGGLSAW